MAVGDYLARRHAAAQTNVSHTTETDQSLDTAVISNGSAFSWDGTNERIDIDEAGLVFSWFNTFTRSSGTSRSHGSIGISQNAADERGRDCGGNGYCRLSGGADEMAMTAFLLDELALNDHLTPRRGVQSVNFSADNVGDYNTTAGDPIGFGALMLDDTQDYLETFNNTNQNIGILDNTSNDPPYDTSDGTWTTLDFTGSTGISNGTDITAGTNGWRAQNHSGDLLLLKGWIRHDTAGQRINIWLRLKTSTGTVLRYVRTKYIRNTADDLGVLAFVVPWVPGSNDETVEIEACYETEGSSTVGINLKYGVVYAFPSSTEFILAHQNTDLTTIDATRRRMSGLINEESNGTWTVSSDNVSRTFTGTRGFFVAGAQNWQRSNATSGTRKAPILEFEVNSVAQLHIVDGAFNRGQQSADDCFISGPNAAGVVEATSGQSIAMTHRDLSSTSSATMLHRGTSFDGFGWMLVVDLSTMASTELSITPALTSQLVTATDPIVGWSETESFESVTDGTNVTTSNTLFDLVYTTGNVVGDDGDIHTALDGTDYALINATSQTGAVERQNSDHPTEWNTRFAIYNSETTPNTGFIYGAGDGNTTDMEVRINTDRTLTIRTNFIARATTTASVPADGWFSCDVLFDGTNFTLQLYNTAQSDTYTEQLTTTTSVPADIDRVALGNKGSSTVTDRGLDWVEFAYWMDLSTRVAAQQDITPTLESQLAAATDPSLSTTYDITVALVSQLLGSTNPSLSTTASIAPALVSQLASTQSIPFGVSLFLNQFARADQPVTATDPTLTQEQFVDPGVVSQILTSLAATITSGQVTIDPALVSQLLGTTAPTITTGDVSIDPALVSQLADPTEPDVSIVGGGQQDITAALVSQLVASLAATVTPGSVDIDPALASQLIAALAASVATVVYVNPSIVSELIVGFDPTVEPGDATIDPAVVSQLLSTFAHIVSAGESFIVPDLESQLATATNPTIDTTVFVSPSLASQLLGATDPEVAADAITLTPALESLTIQTFGPTFRSSIDPGLVSELVAANDPSVAVQQLITALLESQLVAATDPTLGVGDTTITPDVAVQLVSVILPTLSGGRVETRETGVFLRLPDAEPILVLGFGPGRGRLTTHSESEGWQKVSGNFVFPWDTRDAVNAAVQAAWNTNKSAAQATLLAAINAALMAAGYRRADGSAIDETGTMT